MPIQANDPGLKSFIAVDKSSDFPIQNIPFGVISTDKNPQKRIATRIGDVVVDLGVLEKAGLLNLQANEVFSQPNLNYFMELGQKKWSQARLSISELLRSDAVALKENLTLQNEALIPIKDVKMHLPAQIGDYTDFYSSKEHASNVGAMFRDKENPLLPNWLHLPVGYHGRASSVIIDGEPVVRPLGQLKGIDNDAPHFGACQRLDFELEMACFIGAGNKLGQPIRIADAENHIFGVVLMNDWSARDIQKWEYVPLGPFTAKNFATSISPWVVSLEALEPFKVQSPKMEKPILNYLKHPSDSLYSYDIQLFVDMKTKSDSNWQQICQSNSRHLYWSMAQQITHHTITGCNLSSGDLLATGTISGQTEDSYGSLLEQSWGGKNKISINSQQRTFLEDGDGVRIRGFAEGADYKIGFGQVSGFISPSIEY